MNSFLLNDYKDELIKRFNYEEEFAQEIALMAESLADYFGEEFRSIIYDAIASCKFVKATLRKNSVIHENVSDVMNRENIFVGENLNGLKTDRGFFSRPILTFDNGHFKLSSVERIIVLPAHFNSASPESLGILARACIELVKSSYNTYTIRGNVLTTKSGFMIVKENLEYKDGSVVRTVASCIGKSLKRGMDSYDQLCVIRSMYDNLYDVHGEDYERLWAGFILETRGLKDELRLSEIVHDDSQLKDLFKQSMGVSFEKFLVMMDGLAIREEKRLDSLIDADSLITANADLDEYFGTIITEIQCMQNATDYQETSKKRTA